MGSCCMIEKLKSIEDVSEQIDSSKSRSEECIQQPLNSHVTTEISRVIKINTPILKGRISQLLSHKLEQDQIEEYIILCSDSSDSHEVKKGILKSVSGKSLKSGGSSVSSQNHKKVQFSLGNSNHRIRIMSTPKTNY